VAARLIDVISYRMTDADRLRMEKLRASFGGKQGWRETHEWVLRLPGVAEAINQQIEKNHE
jgi:hypothetical protein